MQKKRKRFIAGAVCPSCGVTDKLYIDPIQETETIVCADCEFSQSKDQPPQAKQEQVIKWKKK